MWGTEKFSSSLSSFGDFKKCYGNELNFVNRLLFIMMILNLLLLLPHMACKTQAIKCSIQVPIPIDHKYFQPGDLLIGGMTSFVFITRDVGSFVEDPHHSLFPTGSLQYESHFYYPMVPGEELYYSGIIRLLLHFRWTWVGIFTKGLGGRTFEHLIFSMFPIHGICIAFLEKFRPVYINNFFDNLKWLIE
ncbi:hypothetical protein E2320_003011, partial [Naja naja]